MYCIVWGVVRVVVVVCVGGSCHILNMLCPVGTLLGSTGYERPGGTTGCTRIV